MKKLSLVLAAASVMIAVPAVASGGGGGGGGFSGGGFGSGGASQRDPRAAAYSKGRKAFRKRITCKKCDHAGGFTDSKTARSVAAKVKAGGYNLKSRDRKAVLYYMSERYSIQP